MKIMGMIGLAVMGLMGASSANLIYVDFGPDGDVYSDATETYNNFSTPATESLVDSAGAASGISLTYAMYGGGYKYASATSRDAVSGISTDLTADRMYAGTGASTDVGEFGFTLTFSGLNIASEYEIAALTSPTDVSSTWILATGTGDATEFMQDATAADNYFEWKNISSDVGGNIVIAGRAFSNAKWKSIGLSGLTITAVPEPATIGLLGFGAFITLLIRRMKAA